MNSINLSLSPDTVAIHELAMPTDETTGEAKAHFYMTGERVLQEEIARSEPLEGHELAALFPLLQSDALVD